jgi:hypothetical protein
VTYPILLEQPHDSDLEEPGVEGTTADSGGGLRFAPQPDQEKSYLRDGLVDLTQFLEVTQDNAEWFYWVLLEFQTFSRRYLDRLQSNIDSRDRLVAELEDRVKTSYELNNNLMRTMNTMAANAPVTASPSVRIPPPMSTEPPTREGTREPEARSVTQSTTGTTSMMPSPKLLKIPDPPLLSDGKDPSFDTWRLAMDRKMRVSAGSLPNEDYRMVYVASRCTGDAERHLASRMRSDSIDPYTSAEEMFKHLESIFGDPTRRTKAKEEFWACSMKSGQSFHEFLSRFMYLHTEGECRLDDDNLKHTLWRKLTKSLRMNTDSELLYSKASFHQFAQAVGREADKITMSNQLTAEYRNTTAGSNQNASSNYGSASKSSGGGNRAATPSYAKTPNILPKMDQKVPFANEQRLDTETRARYIKEGRCFGCGQTGHVSSACPGKNRTATIAEVSVPNPGTVSEINDVNSGKA